MNKQSLPKIIIKNEIHKFSNAKDWLKFIKNMDKKINQTKKKLKGCQKFGSLFFMLIKDYIYIYIADHLKNTIYIFT